MAAAAACSATSLLGWAVGSHRLAGFGVASYPDWPACGMAMLSLAAAFSCFSTARASIGFPLLVLPLFVGGVSLAGYLTEEPTPIDGLLIGVRARSMAIDTPGRPGLIPSISLLLLAGVFIVRQVPRPGRTALAGPILGAIALGLNLLSITVMLLGFDLASQRIRIPGSLPASLSATFLALAAWALTSQTGRIKIDGFGWRKAPTHNALILLAVGPVVLLPMVDWIGNTYQLSLLETGLLASALNLLLGIVVWAWATRLADEDRRALVSLSRTLDTVPVILADHEGRVLHWSQGCLHLLGWRAEDAVGAEVTSLLKLESTGGWPFRRDLPGDLSVRELEAERRDGKRLALLVRAEQVESGGRSLIAISLTDVSMLRQTRMALQRSEAALEMALESHQIALFDWDVKGGGITWTAAAEERLSMSAGEMRDFTTWQSLVHPDDHGAMMQAISDAVAKQTPRFPFRYRMVGRRGEIRTIEGSGHCIYDEAGALTRCVGINIDVTERDERETALARSEARLRAILQTVPDAMIVIDERGTIEGVSATAEILFGYTNAELVTHNIALLMPEPWANRHDSYLAAYLATGERKVIGKTRNLIGRRKDGSEMPIELNVGEAWMGDKRTFVGFVRDISQRMESEQRLAELNAAYTHSARLNAVGELTASLAHELNQPLAASANFISAAEAMIDHRPDLFNAAEMLTQANGQILRAGEIIRRLRDFIAKSDAEIRIESLPDTLHEAVELGLTGSRQLRIETQFDLDPEAESFLGDRIQIEQVVVNLVRNAAQALREIPLQQRFIYVSSSKADKDFIVVRIADTGQGLPEHILNQLSKPFVTTKGDEGLGLGVSICRRIVEAHGGVLTATNRPEGGAVFEFTLPYVGQEFVEEAL